jgi:hypothetical protein
MDVPSAYQDPFVLDPPSVGINEISCSSGGRLLTLSASADRDPHSSGVHAQHISVVGFTGCSPRSGTLTTPVVGHDETWRNSLTPSTL